MTQYNTLKVKLSNSQLNKLKSGIKNGNKVTMKILSNVVGDSKSKVLRICTAFANNFSANIKL